MQIGKEITIKVSPKAAAAYQKATATERECLEALVTLFFDEDLNSEIDFLGKIMDEISDRAASRGLTPEILDSILNE
ncbi:MAG TPA: hypothetical protein V6C46_03160 [Coleofasciculaceae cyanobacterium]